MWSPLHVASIKHSFFTLNQITIPYFALLYQTNLDKKTD
jgi:hypothetical protein